MALIWCEPLAWFINLTGTASKFVLLLRCCATDRVYNKHLKHTLLNILQERDSLSTLCRRTGCHRVIASEVVTFWLGCYDCHSEKTNLHTHTKDYLNLLVIWYIKQFQIFLYWIWVKHFPFQQKNKFIYVASAFWKCTIQDRNMFTDILSCTAGFEEKNNRGVTTEKWASTYYKFD